MRGKSKKVVLIGTGMVGMSFAYSALNRNLCDEMVLIDVDKKRAVGEAMDLNHGLAFSGTSMKIYAGDYDECRDADIVVICAGVNQKPGESRLELLKRNAEVFETIVDPVVRSGFSGIFIVATNPVDIMTRITYELSRFEPHRVIGTGTTLDTARLRYLLGEYFRIDPRNVHAYVIGEHGDSEFTPWSQALLATKPISKVLQDNSNKFRQNDLDQISTEVRNAAQKIILAKRATYYGIGMAITRIVRAVLSDEQSVLTVSGRLRGEYGRKNVFLGNPCIIGRNGIDRTIELSLTQDELKALHNSYDILEDSFRQIEL
ncbi:MAG: L-lactate dehydrogenase [Ruminococcus sp.]|nr:L-lactate dehydrogenase [Ruminococcus sp.]